MENPYEKQSIGLENVTHFEELYKLLEAQGQIPDPVKTYIPERLRFKIERIRHAHADLSTSTTSYGIRKAVERLLSSDAVYKKYTSGSKSKK